MTQARANGAWRLPDAYRPDLDRVEAQLRSITSDTGHAWVGELTACLCLAGGKRLRPSLTLLWSAARDQSHPDLIDAATAVELLHLATLYHDDIIDDGDERRGKPSANRVWGNRNAAIAGTFLFARALNVLARLGPDANRLASDAATRTWRGQARECEHAYNTGLSVEAYRDAVRGKTGALFALACQLGCLSGGNAGALDAAGRFGMSLGMAFQIVDDILDLVSDPGTVGKPVAVDQQKGVYTLPTLLCLHGETEAADELRTLLEAGLRDEDDIGRARVLVRDGGGLEAAQRTVSQLVSEALNALEGAGLGPVPAEALAGLALSTAAKVPATGEAP